MDDDGVDVDVMASNEPDTPDEEARKIAAARRSVPGPNVSERKAEHHLSDMVSAVKELVKVVVRPPQQQAQVVQPQPQQQQQGGMVEMQKELTALDEMAAKYPARFPPSAVKLMQDQIFSKFGMI